MNERPWIGIGRILAALVLAALTAVPAFFYAYAISISAGLCGDGRGWLDWVAAVVPLAVIGSWGLRGGNRVLLAWPAAVLAAAACVSLADYVDPRGHGHCETSTPYSVTVLPSSPMYSARFSTSFELPRRNVT